MKLRYAAIAAVSVLALAPAAALADIVTYNSTPADTWYFGKSNNSTNNTAVLSTGSAAAPGDQLYLRWKNYQQTPPQSVGNLYTFALGTNLTYDWGYDTSGTGSSVNALRTGYTGITPILTITNLGTGQFVTYNTDLDTSNTLQNGSAQNSDRLSLGFLSGVGFNANVNDTYRINLSVAGLSGGTRNLFVDAQIGSGVSPAPEAATWAMMVAGFGLVGVGMRRRKATVRFA